ncbi:MAG: lipoprotein insertase outer membrane protein LolB [Gammaproteobacteria bacterium]
MTQQSAACSRRAGALLILTLITTGCALQRTVPGTAVAWDERREQLLALDSWELRGRIGVKTEQGGGQGRLEWDQTGTSTRLQVAGPFGVGAWELRWDERQAVLSNRAGDQSLAYAGPDALDQMLAEQVGWDFPAERTRFWVLGIAAPGSRSQLRYGADGWLSGLEQDGWEVAFDRFEQQDGFWMPRKITLTGQASRLRLVVDRWQASVSL